MVNNLTIPLLFIKKYLKKFSVVFFVIIITSGLILCVTILGNILIQPYSDGPNSKATFDQATISNLGKMQTSNKNVKYQSTPSGRINPFSE
ncbi:MAG: hypothetical protein WCJ36_02575 [Candidatus Saccharibacteria bacterium]